MGLNMMRIGMLIFKYPRFRFFPANQPDCSAMRGFLFLLTRKFYSSDLGYLCSSYECEADFGLRMVEMDHL